MNGSGSLARAAWILILLACGVAAIPLFGFVTYVIAVPLHTAAVILSIIVLARGGVREGSTLILVSLGAPIFVLLVPWIVTTVVAPSEASAKNSVTDSLAPALITPRPVAAGTPMRRELPKEVTLTKPVQIPVVINGRYSGMSTFPAGARVRLISVKGTTLTIQYGESRTTVAAEATNFSIK